MNKGYVLIFTILLMGTVMSLSMLALFYIGTTGEIIQKYMPEGRQAFYSSQACGEAAILKLKDNSNYAGGETISFNEQTCQIISVVKNQNGIPYLVKIEAQAGDFVKESEIALDAVFPKPAIRYWK